MPQDPDRQEERRRLIRDILQSRPIHSQGELAEALEAQGFEVSQPSVSRDLRELGVARVEGRYVLPEALSGQTSPTDELDEVAGAIQRMQPAGPNLLVIHTPPGRGPVVGLALDGAGWPELVGTVAGDDTIFVATAGRAHQQKVEARLREVLQRSQSGRGGGATGRSGGRHA